MKTKTNVKEFVSIVVIDFLQRKCIDSICFSCKWQKAILK